MEKMKPPKRILIDDEYIYLVYETEHEAEKADFALRSKVVTTFSCCDGYYNALCFRLANTI